MSVTEIIALPLGYVMLWCLMLVENYGVAVLLFTLLTKVLLSPLTMWVHKNSIKMIKLQPELNVIQARNAGNIEATLALQRKLYKREHYKPLAGVIPMLIQIPLILGLISVIYQPLVHILQLDPSVITAFVDQAAVLSGNVELGASAQLVAVNFIKDPQYMQLFASLPVSGAAEAVEKILALDMSFGPLSLSAMPELLNGGLWLSGENFMPLLSAASAFLLSYAQNKVNILQQEASWFGRWGMAIFLTLFSGYFACIVPSGVALYWIASNLMAILMMMVCYWIVPPKKFIDYDAMEKSKELLKMSKEAEKANQLTKEQKQRAGVDYKRFCSDSVHKHILIYSERSGYYRYFSAIIDGILEKSDYDVHYLTSDPRDAILENDNPRIIPYFIDDNRLIPAFMKADSDVILMTMPDIQQFHLKRSYVRKDIEYIYVYHAMVVGPSAVRKGATQHYDTLLCTGPKHAGIEKRLEEFYNWKPRKILECGYPLLDGLIAQYESVAHETTQTGKKILIAPSYQEDNILDSCLEELLTALAPEGVEIIVRPHPQFIKLHPERMAELRALCTADRFAVSPIQLQTDFSDSTSVYESDLLITDWSSIAYEFAFTTKKPVLFIDTPMKVINQDYAECDYEDAPDIVLRNVVGKSIRPEDIPNQALPAVRMLFAEKERFAETIAEIMPQYVCNIGRSAEVVVDYILDTVKRQCEKE